MLQTSFVGHVSRHSKCRRQKFLSGRHVGPILSSNIGRCEQALFKLANLSATNLTYKSAQNVGWQKFLVCSYHLAFRQRTS